MNIRDNTCHSLLASDYAAAGFPSPARDYLDGPLDLNELLVRHQAATFFVRVIGDSMIGAGIYPGDILIVDRSLDADNGKIIIAVVDGEFTVKRLRKLDNRIFLEPANRNYRVLEITEAMDSLIWGVVTAVIHFP